MGTSSATLTPRSKETYPFSNANILSSLPVHLLLIRLQLEHPFTIKTIADLWQHNTEDKVCSSILCSVLWNIWERKNWMIFRNKDKDPHLVLQALVCWCTSITQVLNKDGIQLNSEFQIMSRRKDDSRLPSENSYGSVNFFMMKKCDCCPYSHGKYRHLPSKRHNHPTAHLGCS